MKIHYIVSIYTGKRPSKYINSILERDPYHFVKKHLECFKQYDLKDISKVTFVVNVSNELIDKKIDKVVKATPIGKPVQVVYRENLGLSYAGWNEVIKKSLDAGEDYDYFFLIEDDYIPAIDKFYQFFADKFDDKTFFVAQKHNMENYAIISNGMLSANIAKKVYQDFGNPLSVQTSTESYDGGVQNQINFLNNGLQAGYTFNDICKETCQIFLASSAYHFYGNHRGPAVLVPESDLDWAIPYRDHKYGATFRSADSEPTELRYLRYEKMNKISKRNDSPEFYDSFSQNIWSLFLDPATVHTFIVIKDNRMKVLGLDFRNNVVAFQKVTADLFSFVRWYLLENKLSELISEVNIDDENSKALLNRIGFVEDIINEDTIILKYVQTQE